VREVDTRRKEAGKKEDLRHQKPWPILHGIITVVCVSLLYFVFTSTHTHTHTHIQTDCNAAVAFELTTNTAEFCKRFFFCVKKFSILKNQRFVDIKNV